MQKVKSPSITRNTKYISHHQRQTCIRRTPTTIQKQIRPKNAEKLHKTMTK